MFSLYQKVVYPGHGVASINALLEKDVAGKKVTFFELTFVNKDVTVLVPMQNAENVGIRHLSSSENIYDAISILGKPNRKISQYDFTASSWNKRNKEYQLKLRNGSLNALSEIYRDLRFIETKKELSFGEKTILQRTESLLAEEIAAVKEVLEELVMQELRSACSQI